MKKIIVKILVVGFVTILTACGATPSENEKQSGGQESSSLAGEISTEESVDSSTESEEDESKEEDQKLLDDIVVTYRQDTENDGKVRMIVDIENKSTKIFTGDVFASFKGNVPKTLNYDTVFVEELGINDKTSANIFVDSSDSYDFSYEFSSYSFTEDSVGTAGEIDEALSKELTTYMSESFGTTSWHKDIQKLEVFIEGDLHYAVVTVSTTDPDSISRITMSVLRNFKNKLLDKVIVNDEAGNKLNEKSK